MTEREIIKHRVYLAAKDGISITLFTLLSELSHEDANELLNEIFIEEDGQMCTPLIIAAKHGQEKVVKILLEQFRPNLEEEGTIKFDGYVIEGASALWCASSSGHLSVVKLLVKAGANVNHATKTNSTPVRAACFDGRLDIVKYLTEHHANIHIPNKYNNSCLMIAAYKGHQEIVTYLLQQQANPNEKAMCGATALYFASEYGHLNIVKELLNYNAIFIPNESNMTPIKVAAERTRADLVQYFLERDDITKTEKIEALELLGASFSNNKDNYNVQKSYQYLHESMQMRFSDPNDVHRKVLIKPIPAYDNWIETENLAELEAIKTNLNALHMESLTIRERILGKDYPELPQPIIFRGAVFADNARFDRCIQLWLHALQLRQLNFVCVVKDLLRFAQVFSQMLHVGVELCHTSVTQVLSAAIVELERTKARIAQPGEKDDPESLLEDLESYLTTTLYLLTILTKLLKGCNDEEKFNINRMVFVINQLGLTVRDGQTLLHLACNAETLVDNFHTNDICKFPCAETARLLIQCGANVNAMDNERNTPLHMIVNYHKPISDFTTLHSIILYLTEAGAHVDSVNNRGETPLDSAATGVAEIILKTQLKLSLKCLAASAVKSFRIPYCGQVPLALESFIELHGNGSVK